MVTERTIINALIIGTSLILAPFAISSTLAFGYGPLLFFGGLFVLWTTLFFLRDRLCIWPLLGTSITGSLNFLPLPLQASHIFCILLILYYITAYVIMRQRRIKLGKIVFLWPILIITSIVLYHNHSLNVAALGGETEGAKPAILIYLVVLAYFCGINVSHPSVGFLRRVPLYFVILASISSIPYFLTTFFPSLAPYLYVFTDNVNVGAYVDAKIFDNGESRGLIGRLGALASLGSALQLYLLCHYPIGTWLRPGRWWVAGLSILCAAMVIGSGFRNDLFSFGLITVVGAWCYYSWRSLLMVVAFCLVGLMLLLASSNNLIYLPTNKLPLIAQRSMSWLPGDWDEEAIASAESSNHFRKSIRDVYVKEYMDKSPWIGNGFDIDTKEFKSYSDVLGNGGADDGYLQAKAYVLGKIFHIGWISVYDCVGLVGSVAFVALGWSEIRMAAHFVLGPKADRRSPLFPLYVWILCNIVTMMIAFFTVFGDFGQTFSALCIYAIVLSQLSNRGNAAEVPIVLSQPNPDISRVFMGAGWRDIF